MGGTIRELAAACAVGLLANHRPVVSGHDLASPVSDAEELGETAKLLFLSHDRQTRSLMDAQVDEGDALFPRREPARRVGMAGGGVNVSLPPATKDA